MFCLFDNFFLNIAKNKINFVENRFIEFIPFFTFYHQLFSHNEKKKKKGNFQKIISWIHKLRHNPICYRKSPVNDRSRSKPIRNRTVKRKINHAHFLLRYEYNIVEYFLTTKYECCNIIVFVYEKYYAHWVIK